MKNTERYKQAKKLRKNGKSYASIGTELGISKSTISSWFANKPWSNEIKVKLNGSRLKMATKNLLSANIAKASKQIKKRESYVTEAQVEFERLIKNPLFLIGLGIYWGEGDKTDNGRVAVINTDPELLRVIANFYRQCLGISDSILRIGLFLYEDIDREMAVAFWSDKLTISRQQFIKIQVLKSHSRLTKHKTKYGICSLYFSSTRFSIKIHEWIRLLSRV